MLQNHKLIGMVFILITGMNIPELICDSDGIFHTTL